MKVAFYKSETGNMVDALVSFATATWAERFNGKWRTRYSHCELVIPTADSEIMFSSSGRDKKVRFKPFPGGEHWDTFELNTTLPSDNFVNADNQYVGKDYDYVGAFVFILPFRFEQKNKWFCSELLVKVFLDTNTMQGINPSKVDPQGLHDMLIAMNLIRDV